MRDGKQIKYERLKSLERRAQHNNHAALCLPVYRKLVYKTTELIAPSVQEFVDTYHNAPGRPGHNAIAAPFLNDLGAKKVAALAVVCTVNNFHRPISYQSLAVKIGNDVASEWVLSQEDSALVKQINKYRYGSISNRRKVGYLKKILQNISRESLQQISPRTRASIGNALLGILTRTELIDVCSIGTKGLHNIIASSPVIKYLEDSIHDTANTFPILLPLHDPYSPECDGLIRPQKGQYTNLSTVRDNDTDIYKAADILNHVGWSVNKEQLDFITECSDAKHSILGLPYIFDTVFPSYDEDTSEERVKDIKRARAILYSERNSNRSKRARLLSSLSMLPEYCGTSCYFNTEADFRGRLYTTSELVSYQGPDWLRSLWHFDKGENINDQRDLDWLYTHAANCYGYNRVSFDARINFIKTNLRRVLSAAQDPWGSLGFLEKAKHPFRFLAACREIKLVKDNGWGTPSTIPVQIDATSQGIQIWSTLAGDHELMHASNVLGDEPRDVYQEFADTINDIALTTDSSDCIFFRTNPIQRSLAKKTLLLISYGGTIYSVREAVDGESWSPPFVGRQWLTRVLFEQAEDLLCSIIKLQRSFSRGVRTYHDEHPDEDTYVWSAPSGVTVRQKYMKDRRIRIKDVVGNTLHSYRVDTNTHNPAKSASAFPPNLVHSLDASILCKGIVQASTNHNINSFMAIHDCIGIHAAHASTMSSVLSSAYSDVIYSDEVKDLQKILLGGGINCVTMGLPEQGNLDELSSYLFS